MRFSPGNFWLIYKVAMAFWINIFGCQPYPRHGPLSVNQLKNDSYHQALYTKKKVLCKDRKKELGINSFLKVSLSQKKNHLLREVRSEGNMETPKFLLRLIRIFGVWHYYIILKPIKKPKSDDWCSLQYSWSINTCSLPMKETG